MKNNLLLIIVAVLLPLTLGSCEWARAQTGWGADKETEEVLTTSSTTQIVKIGETRFFYQTRRSAIDAFAGNESDEFLVLVEPIIMDFEALILDGTTPHFREAWHTEPNIDAPEMQEHLREWKSRIHNSEGSYIPNWRVLIDQWYPRGDYRVKNAAGIAMDGGGLKKGTIPLNPESEKVARYLYRAYERISTRFSKEIGTAQLLEELQFGTILLPWQGTLRTLLLEDILTP